MHVDSWLWQEQEVEALNVRVVVCSTASKQASHQSQCKTSHYYFWDSTTQTEMNPS